ncbi:MULTISPECIES: hypothetical protein [unclassified Gordonia (in: high G+C Gram-positive bacteria)]|uniref:hypothetical protein n=1 Tax=unclassified Gordonia (in: high G+C Gram-positive bacteria) TaxID=2657482 RepID=UPI001966B889|nr:MULTISPECIES: hypothetical protein [unclassified Gordonia (in: high G+C Gram-positive bacteria)]MBN0974259.1 hypothetical protein [Gordonia sp. BP-119]MBN0981909.1 hypothetical protein [Gordonia sp. BP-94]
MTASTSGSGPRSRARIDAIEARRQRFADYVDRQLRDPTPGTTWHPAYQWPSETDEMYAARRRDETTGRLAGEMREI